MDEKYFTQKLIDETKAGRIEWKDSERGGSWWVGVFGGHIIFIDYPILLSTVQIQAFASEVPLLKYKVWYFSELISVVSSSAEVRRQKQLSKFLKA